jgi:tetratricopeptide (TPR) repeat protein
MCLRSRPAEALAALILLGSAGSPAQDQLPLFQSVPQATNQSDWKVIEEQSRKTLRARPRDESAAVLHATSLIHLSQPFDAVLELEDYLNKAPGSVEAGKLYAALLAEVVNDRTQAEQELLRVSRLAPADANVWEGLGKLYLGHHKEADAVRCFREAVRLSPRNPVYVAELAQSLEKSDQPDSAGRTYAEALRLSEQSGKPDPVVYTIYAGFLANQDRFSEAITFYTKALAADPHSADALQGRAVAREKLGDMTRAESDALAALRESPRRRDCRQLLLRVYRAADDNRKAQEQADALGKIIEQEQSELARGREMRASLNAAEALLAQGKYAEAIPPYERVAGLMPSFYEAQFALGICYQQTGRTAEAEQSLRKYLSFQPLSADGHAALGILLMAGHRNGEAKPLLERALEMNPDLAEPRKALAHVLFETRDFAGAADALEPVLENPGTADAESFMLAAQSRAALGQSEKAIEICEAGLGAYSADTRLEKFHGTLLAGCGHSTKCKVKALQALKQHPASGAYLMAVTSMLIESSAIDETTADMVNRMRQSLPGDIGAQYLYAKWAYSANRLDTALDEASGLSIRAGAEGGMKARALTLVGLTQERLGNYGKAESAFRQSLETGRKLLIREPQLALSFADFLIRQSREDEADSVVAEVLQWSPDNAVARLRRATYLANSGRMREAIPEAKLALEHAADDAAVLRAAHALLAKTYSAVGDAALAKVHQDWIIGQIVRH